MFVDYSGIVNITISLYNRAIKGTGETKMKEYREHHTALVRGYVSVNEAEGIKASYKGRFGEGYTIRRHNPDSTRYCFITYYVA